jgi:hypothetical protein
MRPIAPLLLLLAGASAAPTGGSGAAHPASGADSADFIIYEAEEGDRLSDLADRHFLRPEDWRKARALNGLSDDRLKPGTRIKLDTAWLRRTPLSAEVVAFRGDSVILKGASRLQVARGAVIAEGDRIITGAMGFVTLRLSDGGELSIPTNSSVRFLRLRGYTLGGLVDRRLQVEQGSLDNKVTPFSRPGHRHEVTTPVSVAAVRGTEFRVSFTPGSSTAITEVLEGRVGVLAVGKSRSGETLVSAEHGVAVTVAGVGRVEAMLPPPILEGAGPAFRGARLATSVRREAGIAAWRLELATDAAFTNRVAELMSTDGEFDVGDLSPGLYHARLRAMSPSGIAGRPTTFTVRGPGLTAALATPPAPDEGSSAQGSPAEEAEVASLGEGPSGLRKMVADMADYAEESAPLLQQLFAGEEGDASDALLMAANQASGGGGSGGGGGSILSLAGASPWGASTGTGGAVGGAWAPALAAGASGRWPAPGAVPGGMGGPPVLWPAVPTPFSGGQIAGVLVPGLEPVPSPAGASPTGGASPAPPSGPASSLVPEPQSWMMLIAGFGWVGLTLRRRLRAGKRPAAASG